MYYVTKSGGEKTAFERLDWVKKQMNGVFVRCQESEGQGVLLDNEIFGIAGKRDIGKPLVAIEWADLSDVLAAKDEDITQLQLAVVELYETYAGGE